MHTHARRDILPPLVPTCIVWKKLAELIVAFFYCASCCVVGWWPFVAVDARVELVANLCVPISVFLRFDGGMIASTVVHYG